MVVSLKVEHAVYTSSRERLQGRYEADEERLGKLLLQADSCLDREEGGWFFETFGGTFVFGQLTPWPQERERDFFFNVFSFDVETVATLDLVWLRNVLGRDLVTRAQDGDIYPALKFDREEMQFEDSDAVPMDEKAVSRIWDAIRRPDQRAIASLEDVSRYKATVENSLRELSFVSVDYEGSEYFDIRAKSTVAEPLSEPDPVLVEILREKRRDGVRLERDDLPDLEQQHRAALEGELEKAKTELRETVDLVEPLDKAWENFLEEEVKPVLDLHVDRSLEQFERNVHPDEELDTEDLDSSETGVSRIIPDILDRGEEDLLEAALHAERDRLQSVVNDCIEEVLKPRVQKLLDARFTHVLDEAEVQRETLRRTEAYRRYKNQK